MALAGWGKDLEHGQMGCRFALVWQNLLRITRRILNGQTNPVQDLLEVPCPAPRSGREEVGAGWGGVFPFGGGREKEAFRFRCSQNV